VSTGEEEPKKGFSVPREREGMHIGDQEVRRGRVGRGRLRKWRGREKEGGILLSPGKIKKGKIGEEK
jgi:hypothetical protein